VLLITETTNDLGMQSIHSLYGPHTPEKTCCPVVFAVYTLASVCTWSNLCHWRIWNWL